MRLDWKGALGIVLSAALLWWTLHGEPLGLVWAAVRDANWWWWLASTVAATLIFPLRSLRWRVILEPAVGRVAHGPLWRATAVGMMANNVLPARAGEVARALALTREVPAVPLTASLASLAVDRTFDLIALVLLLFVAALDPAFPRGATVNGLGVPALARGGVLLIAVLLAGMYGLLAFPGAAERLYRAVARRLLPGFEARGARMIRGFADGLGVLRHPGRFAAVFAWTIAHWLLAAASLWLGFRAVGITAPFTAALFLNSVTSFGTALPSTPGFFGVFETSAKLSLGIYGVPGALAVSWALGYHVLTFVPITVFGAVYAVRLGMSLRDLSGTATEADASTAAPPAAVRPTPRDARVGGRP
jgi:uncharacterized protein (TIRG00374 family)